MTHTPGPWKQDNASGSTIWGANGTAVADCIGVNFTEGSSLPDLAATALNANPSAKTKQERLANARLIAAAPDLLAALEKEEEWRAREEAGALDPEWDYETMVAQYRRAALSKAKA
jgi:hypothetical protein